MLIGCSHVEQGHRIESITNILKLKDKFVKNSIINLLFNRPKQLNYST